MRQCSTSHTRGGYFCFQIDVELETWSPSTSVALVASLPNLRYTWTVDQVAPVASIVSHPPALTNAPSAEFEFGCNEPKCTYDYTTSNGLSWTRVVDSSGGVGGVGSAPTTELTRVPLRVTSNTSATFEVAASSNAASVQYSLDHGAWQLVPGTSRNVSDESPALVAELVLTGLPVGMHEVVVRAVGDVGTSDPSAPGYRWVVDPTAGDDPPPLACAVSPRQQLVTTAPIAVFDVSSNHDVAWCVLCIGGVC